MISPLRGLAVALVQLYRYAISPILPASCRFYPTCSAYALEALRRYGVVTGGWLSFRRLLRCHPWGGCGHDPVPDLPESGRPWAGDRGRAATGCGDHPAVPPGRATVNLEYTHGQ